LTEAIDTGATIDLRPRGAVRRPARHGGAITSRFLASAPPFRYPALERAFRSRFSKVDSAAASGWEIRRGDVGGMALPVNPIPDGYHTVTPYLIVTGAAAFIDFVKRAFGGTERMRSTGPNGAIMHAELQLGDSVIMLADAPDEARVRTAMIHLYVAEVDADYRRALEAGAESLREPADQTYGDRSAGVKDRWGNEWWLATRIMDAGPA